jgi:predicted TIM-barrel fold metal-dependent hydrolase
MTIIDSQVHVYEANTPKRPWHSVASWPDHVTGDEMVAAMDKVGVDGAIFISAFSMYQYDASYSVEVQQAHPGRFAIVKPVNPDDPAVADVTFPSQVSSLGSTSEITLGCREFEVVILED